MTKVECPKCGGDGMIWNPEWEKYSKLPEEEQTLENEPRCRACGGRWATRHGGHSRCTRCNGCGMEPEEIDCEYCEGTGIVPWARERAKELGFGEMLSWQLVETILGAAGIVPEAGEGS